MDTKTLFVHLPNQLKIDLKKMAASKDTSIKKLVETAIVEMLAKNN